MTTSKLGGPSYTGNSVVGAIIQHNQPMGFREVDVRVPFADTLPAMASIISLTRAAIITQEVGPDAR